MPLPKITIVTPSFNSARYLEATLRSVLDQQYPSLEYLLFDGGSADTTRRYWIAILHRFIGGRNVMMDNLMPSTRGYRLLQATSVRGSIRMTCCCPDPS
ncbi:MAG: glycosyltransferase [Ignavibacteriae bacterium]|nr:glycosyltransferase [Ignavibacteriota bacterium]